MLDAYIIEKIKQEAAESKAAVEIATGSIDTQAIERERTSRKIKVTSANMVSISPWCRFAMARWACRR